MTSPPIETESGWPIGPSYTPRQALFLARLDRAERLRIGLVLKGEDRSPHYKLAMRAAYAFWSDCVDEGVGSEALEVIEAVKTELQKKG